MGVQPTPPTDDEPALADDDFHSAGEEEQENQPQPQPQPVIMADFDAENGNDPNDVYTKAAHIKLEYNPNNVEFWFNQIEAKMRFAGVASQWTKLQVLITLIPSNVSEEIKHLLRVSSQANATATCYKDAKDEILALFGRQDDETYDKANQLMLTSTPSALMKKIVDIVCPTHPKLQSCCSASLVTGIWKSKLPQSVKAAIAGQSVKNNNFDNLLKLADAVYKATKQKTTPTVAATTPTGTGAEPAEAAALQRGQGRGQSNQRGRGGGNQQNRGGGRGAGNTGGNGSQGGAGRGRSERHPDNPPKECCSQHFRFGKTAWYCKKPFTCPWRTFVQPNTNN